MTTNADYTFTPHPCPEEIQGSWCVRLLHLNEDGENHAITTRLRSIWRDNWWKYPDDIKFSFLSATFKTAITKSNARSPYAHVLYRQCVKSRKRDLDWGIWLVLRAIYYDVHQDLTDTKVRWKRLIFRQGEACQLITQRYPGADVLQDNVPPTFPPRPSSWENLGDAGPSSSLRPETPILASTDNCSIGDQASTSPTDGITDSGVDSDGDTTVDESDDSPTADNAPRKVEKEAKAQSLTPDREDGSPSRENLDLSPSSLDAATSGTSDDSTQHVHSSTSDSSPASNDDTNKVVSEQGPANEGGRHSEKAADTSNNSIGRSDKPKEVPKSLPKRSMSADEEEDSSCSEHTLKRRCTSSDQSHPTEPEATPSSGIQEAIFGMDLDQVHELWKKNFDEKVAELVSEQVTQQAESLWPRLKDQIAQTVSAKIFGVTENSGQSSIVQQVVDSMAEQIASKIIQQVMQHITREVTSELQPKVDKQIADCIAQIMMDKLFGSTGIPGI